MGHGSSKLKTWMIVIAAVAFGAYFARMPWQIYREQRSRANDAVAEAQVNETQRIGLLKRQAELKSRTGKEKIARERGYLAKGETPYATASTP